MSTAVEFHQVTIVRLRIVGKLVFDLDQHSLDERSSVCYRAIEIRIVNFFSSLVVVTDNDGVDDSSGETLFLRLGNVKAIN